MNKTILGALDIGTAHVVCLVAQVSYADDRASPSDTSSGKNAAPEVTVLGIGSCPSRGVKRGVVVDVELVVNSVKQSLNQACIVAGGDPKEVDRYLLAVNADVEDTSGALASSSSAPAWAMEPNDAWELENVLSKAGIGNVPLEYIRSADALGLSLTTPPERQEGCAIVDLGSGKTVVGVYRGGCLRAASTFPFGAYDILAAMHTSVGLTMQQADDLLRQYGHALRDEIVVDECLGYGLDPDDPDADPICRLTKRELASLIEETLSRWFREFITPAILSCPGGEKVRTVVLAGRAGLIPGVTRLAAKTLREVAPAAKVVARRELLNPLGSLMKAFGITDSTSVVRGLLLYGAQSLDLGRW